MKKLFALLTCIFLFSTSLFAQQKIVSFSAGLSSGVIFYGSEELKEINNSLEGNHRIIIGGLAELDINPIKEVSFFGGCDLLADFNNTSPNFSNHLALDFPFGIKVYPGLEGFNFGIAYAFGFRTDSFNLEETGKSSNKTPIGNGFKILMEYNFAHCGKSQFLPSIGVYWKHMPRGENAYDNHLCAYIAANF